MSAYLPTIRQLQYLVALYEHGHFSRAASATSVSQSTLSAGIRELESLLGASLVERSRRVVRFTPLGEQLVLKARRLLREAEELVELVNTSGEPLSGVIRMSVIPTIAPFTLPTILPRLRKTRPKLTFQLREETSGDAVDSLHNARVDCVLLALPFATGEVDKAHICNDELYVALPRDNPRDPPQLFPAASIDEAHFLLLEDGHCLKEHALAACSRPELRTSASFIGTSLHTLIQMVDNDLGQTMVPRMAIDAGILNGTKVVARRLAGANTSREIALIWRKHSPRSEEFQLLASELREAMQRAEDKSDAEMLGSA